MMIFPSFVIFLEMAAKQRKFIRHFVIEMNKYSEIWEKIEQNMRFNWSFTHFLSNFGLFLFGFIIPSSHDLLLL